MSYFEFPDLSCIDITISRTRVGCLDSKVLSYCGRPDHLFTFHRYSGLRPSNLSDERSLWGRGFGSREISSVLQGNLFVKISNALVLS